jgi:hypothetical protein
MELIIVGCTSNICKIRVFDNLNRIHKKINKIYCIASKNYNQNQWKEYINSLKIKNNNIINKVFYIQCQYNLENYKLKLGNIIKNNTYIYVSTPPICYRDLLVFINEIDKGTLILEKPLALNYDDFKNIEPFLNNRTMMIDHFIFKTDIQKIFDYMSFKKKNLETVKKIQIVFHYENDVEDRLGFFDQCGFFVDMFQSHLLSIIYIIIGDNINKILKSSINIDRKQYKNYGGKNKDIETYFNLTIKHEDIYISMELGKAMEHTKKQIIINDEIFNIGHYENEYSNFFGDIENNINKCKKILHQQNIFWKITNFIKTQFKNISYYEKNKFKGNLK